MSGRRFSLRVNNDVSVAAFSELAVRAEEAGFAQLWVSNDLFLRSAPVLIAAAASRTERIGLGIGVMNPYSVHPAEIAMAAVTLQELSGGRFLLGLSAGAAAFLASAGIERRAPIARTRAAVRACRALMSGELPSKLEGSGTWSDSARLLVSSAPVPIYLGAMSPRMLALAGEEADGVLALSFPPERSAATAAAVREAARSVGRNESELDIPACFWCAVDADVQRAEDAMAEKLAYYGPSLSPLMLADAGLSPEDFVPASTALARGDAKAARRAVTPGMLALAVVGDTPSVLARCRRLAEAGAEHLSFGPPLGHDPLAALEQLATEVLPPLRNGA